MNNIRRNNGMIRNSLLAAASLVALAAGTQAHATDEMVVIGERLTPVSVEVAREVELAVSTAREQLNLEIRRELSGPESGVRLMIAGLERDSRG